MSSAKKMDPNNLTQAEVDQLFIEAKQKLDEEIAVSKIKAQNEAFDHFIDTGEVVPVPEAPIRFLYRSRIKADPLPDIDFDETPFTKIRSL